MVWPLRTFADSLTNSMEMMEMGLTSAGETLMISCLDRVCFKVTVQPSQERFSAHEGQRCRQVCLIEFQQCVRCALEIPREV